MDVWPSARHDVHWLPAYERWVRLAHFLLGLCSQKVDKSVRVELRLCELGAAARGQSRPFSKGKEIEATLEKNPRGGREEGAAKLIHACICMMLSALSSLF